MHVNKPFDSYLFDVSNFYLHLVTISEKCLTQPRLRYIDLKPLQKILHDCSSSCLQSSSLHKDWTKITSLYFNNNKIWIRKDVKKIKAQFVTLNKISLKIITHFTRTGKKYFSFTIMARIRPYILNSAVFIRGGPNAKSVLSLNDKLFLLEQLTS